MKKLLLVMLSTMILLSFTACGDTTNAKYVRQIETELGDLKQVNVRLNQENADLQKQVDDLQTSSAAASEQVTDPQAQRILDDLPNQIDLIPIQAELGGTLRYYPEQSKILNQNNAYAYAEDGHVAVDMILNYVINADNSIAWSLAAYDIGEGWILNS